MQLSVFTDFFQLLLGVLILFFFFLPAWEACLSLLSSKTTSPCFSNLWQMVFLRHYHLPLNLKSLRDLQSLLYQILTNPICWKVIACSRFLTYTLLETDSYLYFRLCLMLIFASGTEKRERRLCYHKWKTFWKLKPKLFRSNSRFLNHVNA